ncbi:MAG: SBBP repeat-containing protein [Acidobacteria bacterium]|nr:SBBP repeat-containing protein [Acidobacteriota bacterium]
MKTAGLLILSAINLGAALGATAPHGPRLPYTFEENRGQSAPAVRYMARGDGYGLFLTDGEAVLTLERGDGARQTVRMRLDGARAARSIEGLAPTGQTSNYLIGDDRSQWRTGVPHFARVRYTGVYEGVDLVYHSAKDQLEYDFVVAAGARPSAIRMRFDGVQTMRVNGEGALELGFGDRVLVERAPVAYQVVNGARRPVRAAYRILAERRVGFDIGAYDVRVPLVIDPVVVYATFLGGDHTETAWAMAVDPQGAAYITGETTSTNFPTVGAGITKPQGSVAYAFVSKLNAAGTAIVYSTYLGGSSNTRGYAIAADAEGNAYLGGVTGAHNFPLVNAVQATPPGLNLAYVAKLNPQGNALLFSTFFGGDRNDEVRGMALDRAGNIHVVGRATSTQFPTKGGFQMQFGGSSDAFVAMFAAPDYHLGYSTLLGADAAEEGNGIAVGDDGAVYVTGIAQGPGLATAGAYQVKLSSPYDAFAAKISAAGDRLEWFTYYGGRGNDLGYAIALDTFGNVLVGGSTTSNNLSLSDNAVQKEFRGDADAFLAKFTADGRNLLYGTYLGSTARGAAIEAIRQIAVDAMGNVTVAGIAAGADFPAVRPLQAYGGGHSDGFVARFNASLAGLTFSTPMGGASDDAVYAMALDGSGGIRLAGDTGSANFPLKNAMRNTFGGSSEAFVAHVCDPLLAPSATALEFTYELGKTAPAPQTLAIAACAPIPYQVAVDGAFVSASPLTGATNGSATVSVDPKNLEPGVYNGYLRITAPDAANSPLAVSVTLTVSGPKPVITSAGIVHAATGVGGAVAPGELVVLYGQNLGPNALALAEVDAQGRMSTSVKSTRVYFDGMPAPVVYASAGQVSVVVPYGIAGRPTVRVDAEYLKGHSTPVNVAVVETAPGIFTANSSGTGQGSILNQDYGVNGPSNPAARGSVVLIYGTGEGQTDPQGVDGSFAGAVLPKPLKPVSVTIGGVPAQVLYAGAAPGLVAGVLQVNAVVPDGVPAGAAEVRLTVGGAASRAGVTVSVK